MFLQIGTLELNRDAKIDIDQKKAFGMYPKTCICYRDFSFVRTILFAGTLNGKLLFELGECRDLITVCQS